MLGRHVFFNAFIQERFINAMTINHVVSPYLTAPEAANYLRTSVLGIYSLVKRGKVRPMPGRPGRLLFTAKDLDNYLNSRFRR